MFVWFVKVKIDRYIHISNFYLHMFLLPVCFKRSFCIVWLFVEGYIYYTRGRAHERQTRFCNGVGSLSQIQIPKFRSLYINDTINNFQCITSVQCTLSMVILPHHPFIQKENVQGYARKETSSKGLGQVVCGIMCHRIKWRAYLT
jgi:hypothetical protein